MTGFTIRVMSENGTSTLYRSRTDRVWKGVCGGIARSLRLDPIVVRLLVVAVAWATNVWPVLIAYLIAGHVLPVRSREDEAAGAPHDGAERPVSATVIGWGAIILGGALLLHRLALWVDGSLILAVAAVAIGINLVTRARTHD